MNIQQETFRTELPIQIRFNDIDSLGHINNNIYFSYFDLGKTTYLEELRGYAVNWLEGAIVIAHIETDFLNPVFYTEEIVVDTKVTRLGNKSGDFLQQVRNIKTNEIKCVCKSVFVTYNSETKEPMSIPNLWREAISKFEGKQL